MAPEDLSFRMIIQGGTEKPVKHLGTVSAKCQNIEAVRKAFSSIKKSEAVCLGLSAENGSVEYIYTKRVPVSSFETRIFTSDK